MLYDFTNDISKGKAQENTREEPLRYTEILCHIPSMQKYIPIHECVEEDKNAEKEKKVGMTH